MQQRYTRGGPWRFGSQRGGPRRFGSTGMRTFPTVPLATLGDSFQSFFDAVDQFFSNLASVRLVPLVLALLLFTAYLTLRARASFNILRAAYPTERFQFRETWCASSSPSPRSRTRATRPWGRASSPSSGSTSRWGR